MPATIGHPAVIEHRRFAPSLFFRMLVYMYAKAHPRLTIAIEAIDTEGVQCRSSGTGIDLGFDVRNAKLRQRKPFAPAERNF